MTTAKQHNASLSDTDIDIIRCALKYTSDIESDVANQDPDAIPQDLHDEVRIKFEAYQDAVTAMAEWAMENHPETSHEQGWDDYI